MTTEPAHIIRSDAEAIEAAHTLAAQFAADAVARDRDRRLPLAELTAFSQSGLWAITVPRDFGGAQVSAQTLVEVTATITAADPSLGQIPQNHFYLVEALRLDANPAQQAFFYERVLRGERFGNALSERDAARQGQIATRVLPDDTGFVLNGRKYYSTGALFADWIVAAALDDQDRRTLVFVPRGTEGLKVIDDWASFGQRTTASGSVVFDDVRVPAHRLVPHWRAFARPTRIGAFAQIIHAAIELGIARAAFADALTHARRGRPAADATAEPTRDPLVLWEIGDLDLALAGAEAMMARAADLVQAAATDADACAPASIAVAEARVVTTEAALALSTRLFDQAGARATHPDLALDRHWRNARTHTLHDPLRSKLQIVGNYWLNDVAPPRHGTI